MKYLNEFRDPAAIKSLSAQIHSLCTRPWKIMEVCGGQTHSIVKYQLEQLLPQNIELVHGPGCPVCVTPQDVIDFAIHLSLNEDITLVSFGDMLRVPGAQGETLLSARAKGAKIEIVYSPLDAVSLAQKNPQANFVFLAVGFETTSLPNAIALLQAQELNLNNFYLLTHQVRVPPAIKAILDNPESQIHGFLAAGHVCTLTGAQEYTPLCEEYKVPIVITGFEPVDILMGLKQLLEMLETKTYDVRIQYSRSVKPEGNPSALKKLNEVFELTDQTWRGLGQLPQSGLKIKDTYSRFDARKKWPHSSSKIIEPHSLQDACPSAKILQGLMKPKECPHFGTRCHPLSPLGAPMVSSEGACAAYFQFDSDLQR